MKDAVWCGCLFCGHMKVIEDHECESGGRCRNGLHFDVCKGCSDTMISSFTKQIQVVQPPTGTQQARLQPPSPKLRLDNKENEKTDGAN
jgi:hypothetical protein